MRATKLMILVPMALLAAACGRNGKTADDALKNDLALASQAQPYNPQQFVSPTEAGLSQNPYAPQQLQAVARQPVARVTRAPARRTSSRSSGSRSSGGYYPAPAPRTTVEKHTTRDAAIGA